MSTPTTRAGGVPGGGTPAPVMLEFFRLDRSDVIVPTLGIAIALTMAGSLLVAVGFLMHRGGSPFEHVVTVLGILSTASGPALVFVRLRRVLAEEAFVALRSDGLALHKGAVETLIAWDELTAARFDEAQKGIVLERRDKEPLLVTDRFSGIDHATLAKRIDDLRRKASFNLLPKA